MGSIVENLFLWYPLPVSIRKLPRIHLYLNPSVFCTTLLLFLGSLHLKNIPPIPVAFLNDGSFFLLLYIALKANPNANVAINASVSRSCFFIYKSLMWSGLNLDVQATIVYNENKRCALFIFKIHSYRAAILS